MEKEEEKGEEGRMRMKLNAVRAEEKGKGLAYAPEDFPEKGDVWAMDLYVTIDQRPRSLPPIKVCLLWLRSIQVSICLSKRQEKNLHELLEW
ncbi:hypothetical protein RIF29_23814 [Crotalaria pallida]|uniref:DUF7081 domain-containing protein n=1 Tax=Crotalaria pallida TaxID=3830 RepID=A0AAN9F8L8_CROPI